MNRRLLMSFCFTSAIFCSALIAEVPKEFAKLDIKIVVAEGHDASRDRIPLLLHFHGDPATCEKNFHRAKLNGVMATINCNGLSSAYRVPFENRDLFDHVLTHIQTTLQGQKRIPLDSSWSSITVSCFSAGYGAVRELLKGDSAVKQIDSVVAADSIYASIHVTNGERFVDADQMQPFVDFAKKAIQEEKQFLLSHSQLPVEPYASTVETADHLLKQFAMQRNKLQSSNPQEFKPITQARKGNFNVLGYAGSDGEAHLEHLRQISVLWKRLR